MKVTAYSDLYDHIGPYLPACPLPVILQALQWAGRDFCRRTERLIETISIDAVEDQRAYALVPTISGTSIKRVVQVNMLSEDDVEDDTDGLELLRSCYELEKKSGVSAGVEVSAGQAGTSGHYQQVDSVTANSNPVYIDPYRDYALWTYKVDTNDFWCLGAWSDYENWVDEHTLKLLDTNDDLFYAVGLNAGSFTVFSGEGNNYLIQNGMLMLLDTDDGFYYPIALDGGTLSVYVGTLANYTIVSGVLKILDISDSQYYPIALTSGAFGVYAGSDPNYAIENTTLPTNCYYREDDDSEGVIGTYAANGSFAGTCIISTDAYLELKLRDEWSPDEDVTDGIKVELCLLPDKDTDVLPDWFINEYEDAIIAGALSRLYAMPRQMWSSKVDAREQAMVYRAFINDTRIDALLEEDGSEMQMHIEGYMP